MTKNVNRLSASFLTALAVLLQAGCLAASSQDGQHAKRGSAPMTYDTASGVRPSSKWNESRKELNRLRKGEMISDALGPGLAGDDNRNELTGISEEELAKSREKWTKKLKELNQNINSATGGSYGPYGQRGFANLFTGHYKQAISDFSRALKPNDARYLIWRGRGLAYFKLGEYESALADLNTSIGLRPDRGELYFYRGLVYQKLGDYKLALNDEKTAKTIRYGFVEVYEKIAEGRKIAAVQNAGQQGDGDGLDKHVGMISTNNLSPPDGTLHSKVHQGTTELGDGGYAPHPGVNQLSGTKPNIKKPTIKKPANSTTSTGVGVKITVPSANAKPKGVVIPPAISPGPGANSSDSKSNSAVLVNWESRENQTIADYSKLIALNPEDADTHFNRGYSYLILGKFADAAADFEKFLNSIAYKGRTTLYAAALCSLSYLNAHQDQKAQEILRTAISKNERREWPFPVLQFLEHKLSDKDTLAKATDRFSATTARAYLGLYCMATGDKSKELEYLRWVKDNGDQHMDDYRLGIGTLARESLR